MHSKTTRRQFLSATSAAFAGGAAFAGVTLAPAQSPAAPAIAPLRPTLAEVDVLVVGGGPAGIGAALPEQLRQERHGCRTASPNEKASGGRHNPGGPPPQKVPPRWG